MEWRGRQGQGDGSGPDPRPLKRPRRTPRKPAAPNPEVRRKLLEAASELILEHGMPALRVEDVARRAGLSVGTFYLYFASKDELFAHLVVEYTERLRERMRASYAGDAPLLERFARSLDAYLDFAAENANGFLHFRDAGAIRTESGRLASWVLDQHARDLRPLLEQGMAAGEFRPDDPELAAQALVGLIQHMAAFWLEHREACSQDDLKRFLLALTGRGIQR
jgi:AcrR family transcriptional regulator